MVRYFRLFLYGILALAVCQTHAQQASSSPNKVGAAASKTVFAQQGLAIDLIRYGDQRKDSLALIQAAKILQTIETQAKPENKFSASSVLTRAESYAQGRADLLALIQDARAFSSRGALQGPIVEHMLAPVNVFQKLLVSFVGGAPARFAVKAEEPAKVEILVLDPSGKDVCNRPSASGNHECTWTPKATGQYQIRIRNLGDSTSELVYFHN